jgi:hypothetical protein
VTDDGRLFAFGGLALVAAAGLVRKGSRAECVYWLREKGEDRYPVEIVIQRWRGPYRKWEVDSEDRLMLATTPDREEAKFVLNAAIALGERVRDGDSVWKNALPCAKTPLPLGMQRYEVWILVRQLWPYEKPEAIIDLRSCLGGFDEMGDAIRLHAKIFDRWKSQRISFRTFAPGETP